VTVDVQNETSTPEIVHWHGLFIPSSVEGAAEEGTPLVPAHGSRRYSFVPRPSGTRWYHSHVSAFRNLKRATYTGQFGFLYVEPKSEPDQYDAEVFLALHGWQPYLGTMGADEDTLDVIYQRSSVNSHSLGYGDPIRVKEGQKIMFRVLNANAALSHRVALAGHKFKVVALDGNRVPATQEVDVLELGTAEGADAIVTMNQPGVWILGEVDDHVRNAGLGVVVEYASRKGPAQWTAPSGSRWDYTIFGRPPDAHAGNVEVVPLVFRKTFAGNRWFDHWTINGKSYPKTDPIRVRTNRRYGLQFDNQSDESHPVHLHRHSFELTFSVKVSSLSHTPFGYTIARPAAISGSRVAPDAFHAGRGDFDRHHRFRPGLQGLPGEIAVARTAIQHHVSRVNEMLARAIDMLLHLRQVERQHVTVALGDPVIALGSAP